MSTLGGVYAYAHVAPLRRWLPGWALALSSLACTLFSTAM